MPRVEGVPGYGAVGPYPIHLPRSDQSPSARSVAVRSSPHFLALPRRPSRIPLLATGGQAMNCRAWSWKLIVGTMAIFGGAASGQAQLRPLAEVPTFPKPSQTLEISSPPPTASAQPTFTLNWYARSDCADRLRPRRDTETYPSIPAHRCNRWCCRRLRRWREWGVRLEG